MDALTSYFVYRDMLFATSDDGSIYAEADRDNGGAYFHLLRSFHHAPQPQVVRKLLDEWVLNRCMDARRATTKGCPECGEPECHHPFVDVKAPFKVLRLCNGTLVKD